MKKSILYILPILYVIMSACNPKAEYSVKPVKIDIIVDTTSITAASAKVDIVPQEDVYYYCGISALETFNNHGYDFRFMQYMVDSIYSDYLSWRKELLVESSPYVASFSSHSLGYGKDSRIFSNLEENSEYVVYAFCVNPDAVAPMGELFCKVIETKDTTTSSLTFAYSIDKKSEGIWFTIEPSNDEETYIIDITDLESLKWYSSVDEYFQALAYLYSQMSGTNDNMLIRGFHSVNLSKVGAIEGEEYVVIAAGYDKSVLTPVYSASFIFSEDMEEKAHVPLVVK